MSEYAVMPLADYQAACDKIREKTGKTETIKSGAMAAEIDSIQIGTPAPVVEPLSVTANGTYNPPDGVDGYSPVTVNVASGSDEEWFNDGDTHIWVTLSEGRTSPMLGVGVNGTVTVDWGDGTDPDTLTGTNSYSTRWTPIHNYANPGDYVIRLTADGEMRITGASSTNAYSCILRHASGADTRNGAYQNAITRVEVGNAVIALGDAAFRSCYSLESIKIPASVTSIGSNAFDSCYSLESAEIPTSVTNIGSGAFYSCYSLESAEIPTSVTTIKGEAFYNCISLVSIKIPASVTSIGSNAFRSCYSLASIKIPASVTSIGSNAFGNCHGVRYYDFTSNSNVPILSSTNAFTSIPSDCEIRVPAALYDEWIAATNWSTYASKIVAV